MDTGTPTTGGGQQPLKRTVKQAVKQGLGHQHLVEMRDAIDRLTAEVQELRETLRAVAETDEQAMALVGRLLTRLDARIEAIESGEERLAAPQLGARLSPAAAGGGPVVVDAQALQSVGYRERGIGRYSYELLAALERSRPDLVGAIVLNPELPPPGDIEPLVATGKVRYLGGDGLPPQARIWHCLSPFELGVGLDRLRPRVVDTRRLFYAVTVYDLIPEMFPDEYLADTGQRRRYRSHLELVRSADQIQTISAAASSQLERLAGIDPAGVVVVGAAPSSRFRPSASRERALASARAAVPGLGERFVLYPGGSDARKNVAGLIAAYGRLPDELRARFQLVVVCELPAHVRAHFGALAAAAGVAERLLLTGYVPDETLLALYQSTELVCFPSFAEGYGLPLAEAAACGAVAVASDVAPLDELVPAEGRFDPADPTSIAATMAAALTDKALRARLALEGGRSPATFAAVARCAAEAYEALLARPRPRWRRRLSVALVTPLPPARSGVAAYSYRLAEELARSAEIELTLFADGPDRLRAASGPAGVSVHDAHHFGVHDRLAGGFDRVVYCLGNSEHHTEALRLIRERPGVVISHDVRLSTLYLLSEHLAGAVPGCFAGAARRMYGEAIEHEITSGSGRPLSDDDARRYGLMMAREVIGLSESFLVSSDESAALARLDALPEHGGRIGVLPFAVAAPFVVTDDRGRFAGEGSYLPPPDRRVAPDDLAGWPLIATFGVVHDVKRPLDVIEAFAGALASLPAAQLAIVGPISEELDVALAERCDELRVSGSVTVTGPVDGSTFAAWLERATVAVQLRRWWNGEASATIGECMATGRPTIATDIGWVRELPDDCVAKLAADATPADLAELLVSLVGDEGRLGSLSAAARREAARRSFAATASALLDVLRRGSNGGETRRGSGAGGSDAGVTVPAGGGRLTGAAETAPS